MNAAHSKCAGFLVYCIWFDVAEDLFHNQRSWLLSVRLWFQSRCALVLGITWRSPGLLAGPAALLKQVSNGYKIRFSQFIMTT